MSGRTGCTADCAAGPQVDAGHGDGVRESTLGWQEVLPDLKARGMNAPRLAVGDGAMGFRSALDRVYPHTRHQRCRVAGHAGLPEPQHHALHDVRARPVCRNPVAQTARVPAARPGRRGRAVPGRYRGAVTTGNGSRWMNLVTHALLSTITL